MKILKEGKVKSEKIHHGSCNYCGCKVEFKEGEAEYRSFPRNESALVVKCPTKGCGQEIFVDV